MSVKLAISGCCGRMGRAIASLALEDSAFTLSAALEASGHEAVGKDYGTVLGRPAPLRLPVLDDPAQAIGKGRVVIEFTAPAVTVEHVRIARQLGKAMVIGTTGLSAEQVNALRSAAAKIPIVFSPNMSIGVNVLFELARIATERLGAGYDVEIIESHHRHKKDAPSGTAKRLADVVAAARNVPTEAIGVHAVRAGDIIGDHTVILAGPSERLELTHRAQERDVFARGALQAARFVSAQRPGLYDMADVLRNGRP